MSGFVDETGREHPASAREVSERSSLTQHSDSDVVYGTHSRSPTAENDSTDRSSVHSDDVEALVGPQSSARSTSHDSVAPLSNKAILWIILPMLLGQSSTEMGIGK